MIDVLYVIGNIFQAMAFELYFDNTMKSRFNRNISRIILILFLVVTDYIPDDIGNGLKIAVIMTMIFILVFLIYDASNKKKIIVVVLITIFQMLAEMLSALILNIFIEQSKNYYMVGYVMSKILVLFILRIVMLKNKDNNDYLMGNKTILSIVMIPVLSVALIILCYKPSFVSDVSKRDILLYSIIFLINYINVIQYENVQEMLRLQNRIY